MFKNGRSKGNETVIRKSGLPESVIGQPIESEHQLYERKVQYEQHEEPRDQQLLRRLDMELQKVPLDVIATDILGLTYKEMIDLTKGIRSADTEKLIPETLDLADVIHSWAFSKINKRGESDQTETQG